MSLPARSHRSGAGPSGARCRLDCRQVSSLFLLAGLVALAGCSRSTTAAASRSASATSVVPIAEATTSTPAAGPVSSTVGNDGAPTVSRCHTSSLSLGLGRTTQSAPEQYQVRLLFTNRSSRACWMFGFPGVDLAGPASPFGNTLSLPRQVVAPHTVVLQAGSTAHALLTYLLSPTACGTAVAWVPRSVIVTPPDETAQLVTPWSSGQPVDNCQASATHPGTYVGPVQPGAG